MTSAHLVGPRDFATIACPPRHQCDSRRAARPGSFHTSPFHASEIWAQPSARRSSGWAFCTPRHAACSGMIVLAGRTHAAQTHPWRVRTTAGRAVGSASSHSAQPVFAFRRWWRCSRTHRLKRAAEMASRCSDDSGGGRTCLRAGRRVGAENMVGAGCTGSGSAHQTDMCRSGSGCPI